MDPATLIGLLALAVIGGIGALLLLLALCALAREAVEKPRPRPVDPEKEWLAQLLDKGGNP